MYSKRSIYILLLSFLILIILIVGFGIVQIFQYNASTKISQKLYKHPFTVMSTAKSINTNIIKIHREMKDLALSSTVEQRHESYHIVNNLDQRIIEQFKLIKERYLGPTRQPQVAEKHFKKWRKIREEIYTLANANQLDKAIAITRNQGAKYVASLIKTMDKLVIFADAKALEFLNQNQTHSDNEKRKLILTLIILVFVSLGLVHLFNRYFYQLFQTIKIKNELLLSSNQALNEAQKLAKIGSWSLNHTTEDLTWSDETFRIFELDKTDSPLSYEDFLSYIHPSDIQKVNNAYSESIKNRTSYQVEHRILFREGRVKHVREKAYHIFSSKNQLLFSHGSIQDITEEVTIKSAQRTQSRLSQMSEMLAMIAHQWRQPLTSIAVVASNIKVRKALGTLDEIDLEDKVDRVLSYTSELSQTISDFQHYFRPEKESHFFTLSDLLNKSISLSDGMFTHEGIELHLEIPQLEPIKNLENEILQVILAIYRNAVDAIVAAHTPQGKIIITLFKDANYQIIEITDNAGGMPEEVIAHIFDPYFSTKSKNGTGLGLFVAKTMVEEHCHGKLQAKNCEQGACFKLSFPISEHS